MILSLYLLDSSPPPIINAPCLKHAPSPLLNAPFLYTPLLLGS